MDLDSTSFYATSSDLTESVTCIYFINKHSEYLRSKYRLYDVVHNVCPKFNHKKNLPTGVIILIYGSKADLKQI